MKELFDEYYRLKDQADKIAKKLKEIELKLLDLYPAPADGQKTYKSDGCKVTSKTTISRRFDMTKFDLLQCIPEDVLPVKIKYEPDTKGIKWLREHGEKEHVDALEAVLIERPSTSVKIEFEV